MKLLETYSNSCSVAELKEPILNQQFYPTPEKYITIQNSSGQEAKNYKLWQDVINLIYPILDKENIQIIQLGSGEVPPLDRVINLCNQTNLAQSIYILKHALCHAGNDSWVAHACATDTPCVSLYGSTSVDAHSPYFHHSKSIFLVSHRNGCIPSFCSSENPVTIIFIKVEDVVNSILSILNLQPINRKTLFVGELYGQTILEVVPDALIDPNFSPNFVLNLRADYLHNEQAIYANLQSRKCTIICKKPLNVNILKELKANLIKIIYEIDDNYDLQFCKDLVKAGLNLELITFKDNVWLNKIKLDFLELPLILLKYKSEVEEVYKWIEQYNNFKEKSLTIDTNIVYYYESRKYILSEGLIYGSLSDYLKKTPLKDFGQPSIVDFSDLDFLNEIQYFNIFSE